MQNVDQYPTPYWESDLKDKVARLHEEFLAHVQGRAWIQGQEGAGPHVPPEAAVQPLEEDLAAVRQAILDLPDPGNKPARPSWSIPRLRRRHLVMLGVRLLVLGLLTVALFQKLGPTKMDPWIFGLGACAVGALGVLSAQMLTRLEEAWHAARTDREVIPYGPGQSVPVIVQVVDVWEALQGQVRDANPPTVLDSDRRMAFHAAWTRRQGGPVPKALGYFASVTMVVIVAISIVSRWQASFGPGRDDVPGFVLHLIVAMALLAFCAITHPFLLAIPELPMMAGTTNALIAQWEADVRAWEENKRDLDARRKSLVDRERELRDKTKVSGEPPAKSPDWENKKFELYNRLRNSLQEWERHRFFTAVEWEELVKRQRSMDQGKWIFEAVNAMAIVLLTYPASLVLQKFWPFLGKFRFYHDGHVLSISPVAWAVWVFLIYMAELAIVSRSPTVLMNLDRYGILMHGYDVGTARNAARRYEVRDMDELRSELRGPMLVMAGGLLMILLEFAANVNYIQDRSAFSGEGLPLVLPAIFTLGFVIVCIMKGTHAVSSARLANCLGTLRWKSPTWRDDRTASYPIARVSSVPPGPQHRPPFAEAGGGGQ